MKGALLLPILCLLFLGCTGPEQEQEPELTLYPEELDFGEYEVGYRTIWTYDITRPPIPYSSWHGRLKPTSETEGRQFQINVWYPAQGEGSARRLTIGDFSRLSFRQTDYAESEASIEFGQNELISKLIDLGGFDSLSVDDLAKLDSLATRSFENADPVDGQFPLVMFPNGMAPFTTSITGEYLASHGFVVVSFVSKGRAQSTKDISARGAEVAGNDIQFVLSEVLKLPFVDRSNMGIMANAVGSSYITAFQAKNRTFKSLISLEGGLLSNFEQGILNALPFYSPENIDVPILAIYSPHPAIDPKYIEHLKHSKRYLIHFPEMREFDYLNHGMYNEVVPNIIGEPRGDIPASYVKAHRIIMDFFDHTLKEGIPTFDEDFANLESTVSDSTFIWDSVPGIPDFSIIKDRFMRQGFSYVDSLYTAQKEFTRTPFSKTFIIDFRNWVAWKKDPDYLTRKGLYELAVESYPASAAINFRLANYCLWSGDSAQARIQYRETLVKLGSDEDPDLDQEYRDEIRERSESSLVDLDR